MTPRTQLLEAAAAEFAFRGFDGATFAGIASRLGKGRSYIQHYARTKEELARQVMTEGDFVAVLAGMTGGIRQLRRACEIAADRYAGDASARAALRLYAERPDLNPESNPLATWTSSLEQLLSEALEDGNLPSGTDVAALAQHLVAGILGYGTLCEASGALHEMPSKVHGFVNDLLRTDPACGARRGAR